MTHEIDPYDHYVQEDSIKWTFDVEENGAAKDLSSASAAYYVLEHDGQADGDAILSDSDSAVTVTLEPGGTTGRIEVEIERGNLARGGEILWQRLEVDVGTEYRRTFSGEFPVHRG